MMPRRPSMPSFGDEAPTTKARSAMAMLAASAVRSKSSRPPPAFPAPEPAEKVPAANRPSPLASPPPAEPAELLATPVAPGESNGRLGAHALPVESPFARKPLDPRLLMAGGIAVIVIQVFIAIKTFAFVTVRPKQPEVATSASASFHPAAPPAPPSTEPMPSAVASDDDNDEADVPKPKPGHFNHHAAVVAIKQSTRDLSDCAHKGVWGKGQVGVIFHNDGSVWKVLMSAPFTGDVAKCVRGHVEEAHIDPFVGIIGPTYVYFVIPY